MKEGQGQVSLNLAQSLLQNSEVTLRKANEAGGNFLTREGYERFKKELDELVRVRRPQIIERIRAARELGDLSENAEYHAAKEEQALVEGRIRELERILRGARIIET